MLSVVIPALAEPYLPILIQQLPKSAEIFVQSEKGLGKAVLCGVKKSTGDVIAVLDADGSHPVRYLQGMVDLTENYDIVVGSRYIKGGRSQDTLTRMVISRCYCFFAQVLFGLKVRDCMSGYIVTKREVFESLNLNPVGYKFGLEILVKSKMLKRFNAVEYPICFERRKIGKSNTGAKQGLKTFSFIIKLFMEKIK